MAEYKKACADKATGKYNTSKMGGGAPPNGGGSPIGGGGIIKYPPIDYNSPIENIKPQIVKELPLLQEFVKASGAGSLDGDILNEVQS